MTVDPNTGAPAPSLATSWTQEQDGLAYVFTLRDKVKFQDGTDFNAAAVCTNFERWFHLPASARPDPSAVAFKQLFRTFSDDAANSSYKSCTTQGTNKVTITLNTRITDFLQAMTQPGFAISSPTALKAQNADVLDKKMSGNSVSAYAEHPVGTGPYEFSSAVDGKVTLTANPNYWGDKGDIKIINFIPYGNADVRQAALMSGKIDGYDLVTAGNFDPLVKNGMQILQRDPFSVMYVGINQSVPIMADLKVRQAVAMALNKDALIRKFFIEGTGQTAQFIPAKLSAFNSAVPGLPYDPDRARTTLAASSYKGEPIKFYYPTDVTRSYLPTPEKVYAEMAAELTAVGFNIQPVPIKWSDGYLDTVKSAGDHALDLLGFNGSYSDPDNFVSPLFGSTNGELGLTDPQLVSKIDRARSLPEGADRTAAYQSINQQIIQTVPAVPIAFPISALAMSNRVESYPVSPVLNEVFNKIKLRH